MRPTFYRSIRGARNRPVKSRAAHVQKVGHILVAPAFFDQLTRVLDLFGELGLGKNYATAPRIKLTIASSDAPG
jgi:hypothetical protein